MAINPSTNGTMMGRITAPDANYPYGSSKDESGAGAGDGTPYFKARADDIFGFQQALLRASSIVPSGNADNVLVSQYLQSLVEQAAGRAVNFDEEGTSAADAYVIDIRSNQNAAAALFNSREVIFTTAFNNTGASTIDVSLMLGQSLGTTIKSIKLAGGADPAAGDITGRVLLIFDLANDWFELINPAVTGANSDSFASQLLHVVDEKAQNTQGGSSVAGVNTRTLNTVRTNEITGASLGSNQITLPAGTYYIEGSAPSFQSNETMLVLYNVTDAVTEVVGQSNWQSGTASGVSQSQVQGRFTIASSKVFELQHDIDSAQASNGLGVAANSPLAGSEVYASARIWKVG
jgi:hypothetical protein